MTAAARKRLKDAVWNLERAGSVAELMALCKADR
jgi:hypothetical protein